MKYNVLVYFFYVLATTYFMSDKEASTILLIAALVSIPAFIVVTLMVISTDSNGVLK